MSLRHAAEKALEALEYATQCAAMIECHHAAEILRAALAEADEPVAWYRPSEDGYDSAFRDHSTVVACTGHKWEGWIPLYTHPPRREPLTEDEITQIANQIFPSLFYWIKLARAVERAHGIGTDE